MQKQLLFKCLTLCLLAVVLLIPLGMIEGAINERSAYRAEAVRAIAANSAGQQTITGPLLVIPVEEEYDEAFAAKEGDPSRTVRKKRQLVITVTPKTLALEGGLKVERRAYGLHSAAVFEFQGSLTGSFDPPTEADLPPRGINSTLSWGKPRLVVGIEDPRGIAIDPKIVIGERELAPQKGTLHTAFKGGFHAMLPWTAKELTQRLPFRIDLRLAGTESFALAPTADMTTADLRANWAHPSFSGGFLPRERSIDDKGFRAQWSVSSLAANLRNDVIGNRESAGEATAFRVRLIDPVDVYRLAVRAVKYGILFIVLSFSAFFMFETIKSLRMHPIQYLLIGLALAIFFLLLTSLSEHIAFHWAYLASALASLSVIGIYLASVLQGWRRSAGFTGALGLLFGALYGVLQSEQNALLLGSLLLFAVLATLMTATRRIDWYQLGQDA